MIRIENISITTNESLYKSCSHEDLKWNEHLAFPVINQEKEVKRLVMPENEVIWLLLLFSSIPCHVMFTSYFTSTSITGIFTWMATICIHVKKKYSHKLAWASEDICIRALSCLLKRIFTRCTSPYTPETGSTILYISREFNLSHTTRYPIPKLILHFIV